MISKLRESLSIVIVGIIMIALFSFGLFMVIKKPISSEHLFKAEQTEVTKPTTEETKPTRIWRGADYGLPAGVVVDDGEYLEQSPSTNWISIQQADGHIVMVKNLEWQLYSAIKKGDIIE